MERYKDLNTQLKLAKVFKAVISAGLVAPVFVSVSACEKAKPVVEETQATATNPTTQETTPSTTVVETAPPTTEAPKIESKGVVEDEGIKLPAFEGLRYEAESNTYFAETGNPYGLEAGAKAGIFYKNILDITSTKSHFEGKKVNGKWVGKWIQDKTKAIEGALALRPEIIAPWQGIILNETQTLKCAIPILFNGEVVKMEYELGQNWESKPWGDKGSSWAAVLPPGTKFYSPLISPINENPIFSGCIYNFMLNRNDWFHFQIDASQETTNKIIYEGEKPDFSYCEMWVFDGNLLKKGDNTDITLLPF